MALPVFLPLPAPKDATPWTILSWGSPLLYGFSQCLRPRPLGREHLSGFLCPYNVRGGESPRPAGCPVELPGFAGNLPTVPKPPTTAPLAGFPNLTAASSSPHRPAIFRQVTFMGFYPTGSCSFHEGPDARRRRHALLTFLPRVALPPFLGGGTRRRIELFPRMDRSMPFVVYRAFVLVKIGLRQRATINGN